MKRLSARLAAAALSLALLTATAAGCAGNPARRPGPGTVNRPGTTTAPGGLTRGGLVGDNTAGRTGLTTGAGGGGAATNAGRMDLGMQVSSFVAGLSVLNGGTAGTTGPARTGGGGGGTVAGPGGSPSGIGMTHTAGAVGSPAGAGSATGAATPGAIGAGGGGAATGGGVGVGTPAGGGLTGRASTVGVSTIIVGNVAFIGIDPSSMAIAGGGTLGGTAAGAGTIASTTGDLSTYIRSLVITQFPQLADVFVTTDKAQVSRIARIHGDMLSGMPATRMISEILTVVRTLGATSGTTGTTGGGGGR